MSAVIAFPTARPVERGSRVALRDGRLARVSLCWRLPSGRVWVVAATVDGEAWEGEAGEVRVL